MYEKIVIPILGKPEQDEDYYTDEDDDDEDEEEEVNG